MKLVILDGYAENPGDLDWDVLRQFGDLTVYDRTSLTDEAEAIQRIGDAEIVITNKTPLTKHILESCPKLQMIAVIATGYNVVDTDFAAEKGIPVCNVPGYGTAVVAQFTFALLLELCHHVGHHSDAVHQGRWAESPDFCFWDFPMTELAGKTLGIVGFGRIGQAVAKIAAAFGMQVLAYSRTRREEGKTLARYVDLDTLLRQSDVISLHCPLLPETSALLNRDTISKMKDGAMVINTSRGPVIDEHALADALNSGKLAGAAVDVVSSEPVKAENPLLTAKNCIITPHIAWAAKESRQRILDVTTENLRAFLAGRPQNVVNL